MGDDIETGRSMDSFYWAALCWLSKNEKKTAVDDWPKPMSSPIINPA